MKINIQKATTTRSPPRRMSRVVTLLLVISFTLSSLVIPVSASEVGSTVSYLELLDYGTSNNGTNKIPVEQGWTEFSYAFPDGGTTVDYVEMLFYCSYATPTVFAGGSDYWDPWQLNVVSLGDGLYRAYGYIEEHTFFEMRIEVYCPLPTANQFVTVYSLRVQSLGSVYSPCTTEYYVVLYDEFYDDVYWQSVTNGENENIWEYFNGSDDQVFHVDFYLRDWRKYDYIDLTLFFKVGEINSIDATLDGIMVPYEIQYISHGSSIVDYMSIVLRLDVRNLDRTIADDVCVSVHGVSAVSYYNKVGVVCCMGLVNLHYTDPVLYWMRKICGINQDMLTELDGIGNAVEAMAGVVGNIYVQLLNNIAPGVSNIYTVLSDYLPDISTKIQTIGNILSSGFDMVVSELGQKLSAVQTTIQTWGQNIVDALTPDTSASDEVGDDMASQATEMDAMNEQLDAVQRPDVDNIDADITDIVSVTDITMATSSLTVVFTNDITGTIFVLALLFMLAAYVLYGKR